MKGRFKLSASGRKIMIPKKILRTSAEEENSSRNRKKPSVLAETQLKELRKIGA